jgi:hypothetical protein
MHDKDERLLGPVCLPDITKVRNLKGTSDGCQNQIWHTWILCLFTCPEQEASKLLPMKAVWKAEVCAQNTTSRII